MQLTVPMDILADKGTISFNMDFDLGRKRWSSVVIQDSEGNALTEAEYN